MATKASQRCLLQVTCAGKVLLECELSNEEGDFSIEKERFAYKFISSGVISLSFTSKLEDCETLAQLKANAIKSKATDLLAKQNSLIQIEKDLQQAIKSKSATKIGEKVLEKDSLENEIELLKNSKEISTWVDIKTNSFQVNFNSKIAVDLPVFGFCVFELIPISATEELCTAKKFCFQVDESPSSLLSAENFINLELKAGYPEKLRNLLYLGTKDGFTDADVRRKTTGKSESLVIMKVEETGRVFGGFTKVSLAAGGTTGKYFEDHSAFVFTVTENKELRIFTVKNPEKAIYRHIGRGIDFGGGGTICVLQESLHEARNGRCWTAGSTYQATDGLEFTTETLAGKKDFHVNEVEVFGLD